MALWVNINIENPEKQFQNMFQGKWLKIVPDCTKFRNYMFLGHEQRAFKKQKYKIELIFLQKKLQQRLNSRWHPFNMQLCIQKRNVKMSYKSPCFSVLGELSSCGSSDILAEMDVEPDAAHASPGHRRSSPVAWHPWTIPVVMGSCWSSLAAESSCLAKISIFNFKNLPYIKIQSSSVGLSYPQIMTDLAQFHWCLDLQS